jgi:rod shape-determining protein MreC
MTWTAGAVAIVAIGVALALFITDQKSHAKPGASPYGMARAGMDTAVGPVSGVLATPIRWINDGAASIGDYFGAVSENRRLKKRVAELQHLEAQAIALRNLNLRYEQLLKLRTEPPIPGITARVVTDARGPFSNARLIDAGTDVGVKVGNPAMTEQGVVGRIVGVTGSVSRLLLLTDPESRTPVLVDRTNARAVLTGDGGPNPRLDYVRGKDTVKNGDMVLTSGDGGLYPRGLPVGVAQQDYRGIWRVRLYSDRSPIDFVRVLVFDDFAQMVDQAKLAAPAMPPLSPQDQARLNAETAAANKPPTSAAAPAAGAAPSQGAPPVQRPAPTPPVASTVAPVASPGPGAPPKPKPKAKVSAPRTSPSPEGHRFKRTHTPDELPQFDPHYPNGRDPG